MKLDKNIIIGLVLLLTLGFAFFTPIGEWAKKLLNEQTLSGQSSEKNDRSFILNENLSVSLKGYNGTKDANLRDFRGKVVFLNFWGSWCPPCVAEMPSIQKLYEEKGNELEIVLITMKDRPEKFLPFLQEHNYTMPVYEASSLLPKALIPGSFPTTYIIDKKGNVVLKEITSRDWSSAETKKLIDKLLTN